MSETQTQIANYLRGLNREPTGPNISEVLRGLQINPGMLDTQNSSLRAMEPISSYGDPGVASPPPAPPRARPLTAVSRPQMQTGSVGALNEVAMPPKTPATPLSSALDKAMQPAAGRATSYDTTQTAPQARQGSPAVAQPQSAPQLPTMNGPAEPSPQLRGDVSKLQQPATPNVGAVDDGGTSAIMSVVNTVKNALGGTPAPQAPMRPPTSYTGGGQTDPNVSDMSSYEGTAFPPDPLRREVATREEMRAMHPEYGEGGFLNGLLRAGRDIYASRTSPEAMWNTLTAPGYFAKEDMQTAGNIAGGLAGTASIPSLLMRNLPGIARAIIENAPPPGSAPPTTPPPNMRTGAPQPSAQPSPWTQPATGAGGRPNVSQPRRAPAGKSPMPPTGEPGIKPFGTPQSRTQQSPWNNKPMGAPTQSVPTAQQSRPNAPPEENPFNIPADTPVEAPVSVPPQPFMSGNTSGAGGGNIARPQQPITPNVTMGTGQTENVPPAGPSPVQPTQAPLMNAVPSATDLSNVTLGNPTMPLGSVAPASMIPTPGQTSPIIMQPNTMPANAAAPASPVPQPMPTRFVNPRGATMQAPASGPSTPIPAEYWLNQLLHGEPLNIPGAPPMPAPAPASPVPPPTSVPKPVNTTTGKSVNINDGPPPVTAVNRGAKAAPKQNTSEQMAYNALLKQMQRSDARRASERTTK